MPQIEVIIGDLRTISTQYLAHQCNCLTKYAKGLSASLFAQFPYADTYTRRREPSPPGTIEVFGEEGEQRIINLYAQYGPGRPRSAADSAAQRLLWFQQCLAQIEALPELEEIAFPWNIGCGLAGGFWPDYEDTLQQWAASTKARRVLLVKLAEESKQHETQKNRPIER